MATKIITKNSSTTTAIPTAGDLVQGELAVNVTDKRLFTENAAGAIVEVGTNPSTLTVTGEIAANGGIALGDGDVATFGAGDDLQIYHDGSHSYISDTGAGNLKIKSGAGFDLQTTTGENYLDAVENGAINLYYDNSKKLATTTSGIDVTGTATATSVNTGAGTAGRNAFSSGDIRIAAPNDTNISLMTISDTLATIKTDYYGGGSLVPLVLQTGTNANQLYLSTSGNVGIGVSAPAAALDIDRGTSAGSYLIGGSNNRRQLIISSGTGDASSLDALHDFNASGASGVLSFSTNSAERVRITSDGKMGLNVSSPATVLHVSNVSTSPAEFRLENSEGYGEIGTNSNLFEYAALQHVFYAKDKASEYGRFDASGNLGIGTSAPSSMNAGANRLVVGSGSTGQGMTIYSSTTTAGSIHFADGTSGDAAYRGQLVYNHSGDYMAFLTAATERMRIDSSGNLLVGTTSSSGSKLYVSSTASGATVGDFRNGSATGSGMYIAGGDTSSQYALQVADYANNPLMRVTGDGHLLVGTTNASNAVAGFRAYSGGNGAFTIAGQPLELNRLSSDGSILGFRKDGTTVGSIGTATSDTYPYFASSTFGFRLRNSTSTITPSTSSGANNDAAVDLGYSGARFKDLYLSSGVYLGGTGAANLLDDYEEGTWTPTLVPHAGTAPTISTTNSGTYTKVGRLVTVTGYIQVDSISGVTTGFVNIGPLPFGGITASGYSPAGAVVFNGTTLARPDNANITLYGASYAGFLTSNNGGGWDWEKFSIFSAGDALRFSLSYYTS